jgi:hypothetical protein
MIRMPEFNKTEEYDNLFVDIVSTAKECLGLSGKEVRRRFKSKWRYKIVNLASAMQKANLDVDFIAAQIIHLRKSISGIINPFSWIMEPLSRFFQARATPGGD